jgi:hypothetical protein
MTMSDYEERSEGGTAWGAFFLGVLVGCLLTLALGGTFLTLQSERSLMHAEEARMEAEMARRQAEEERLRTEQVLRQAEEDRAKAQKERDKGHDKAK